jgi:hypothetical protein
VAQEVSGLRVWAVNQSRFDAGVDRLAAALPHHLAAMAAEAAKSSGRPMLTAAHRTVSPHRVDQEVTSK